MLSTHEELCSHGGGGAGIKVSWQSLVNAEIKSRSYRCSETSESGRKGHSSLGKSLTVPSSHHPLSSLTFLENPQKVPWNHLSACAAIAKAPMPIWSTLVYVLITWANTVDMTPITVHTSLTDTYNWPILLVPATPPPKLVRFSRKHYHSTLHFLFPSAIDIAHFPSVCEQCETLNVLFIFAPQEPGVTVLSPMLRKVSGAYFFSPKVTTSRLFFKTFFILYWNISN